MEVATVSARVDEFMAMEWAGFVSPADRVSAGVYMNEAVNQICNELSDSLHRDVGRKNIYIMREASSAALQSTREMVERLFDGKQRVPQSEDKNKNKVNESSDNTVEPVEHNEII